MFRDIASRAVELMKELIKVGVVSSITGNGSVRVVFPDRDEIVSYDLPVLQHGARRTQGYWMPQVNEQVLCAFLPIGIEQGFVIGSYYSDDQPAPDVGDGAVVVAGETVHLGDYDADDPVVRKSDLQAATDDILSRVGDLVTALNSHSHTAPAGTAGGPTTPPIVPLQDPPPVQTDGSSKVFAS